jgi:hypothetical protein
LTLLYGDRFMEGIVRGVGAHEAAERLLRQAVTSAFG